MPRAILNKSWRQHPTKQQLYVHLPPITRTIKVRRIRYAEHCWRSGVKLISDVLQWTPSNGQEKAGRPARTCLQQLFEVTGCSLEDLPEAMNNREEWRERVRDIRAGGTTRWWWWNIIWKFTLVDCWTSHAGLWNTTTAFLECGKFPPTSSLDMTLNNQMVRFQ